MDSAGLALLVYSAQILVVVCVAELGARLLRVSTPAVRLVYWRAIGVLCLVLPFLAVPPAARPVLSVTFETLSINQPVDRPFALPAWNAGAVVLAIWVGGAAICLLRLLAGAWHLARLRRDSAPLACGDDVESLRIDIAPRAEICFSAEVHQPATFGSRRPIVLLPPGFYGLDEDARRAVVCHELLHVARGDWRWIVLEELVRALLWFHPAVWWIVDQVQLAREQVIDRLVVARTGAKPAYMGALMAFADGTSTRALANAFLRRRHLRSRFRQLSKESHMSTRHLAWTAVVLTIGVSGTALAAARALPLDLGGLSQQAGGATRLEIRLAETAPAAGLTATNVAGSTERIYLHADALATQADVTSARVVDLGGSFGVGVSFGGPASARLATATAAHLGRPVAIVLDGTVIAAPTMRSPITGSAVITGITEAAARELASNLSPAPAAQVEPRDGTVLPVAIREVKPFYSQAAMDAKVAGTVLLEAVVLSDGSVGTVTVERSLDAVYGLDQAAIDALRQWTFRPGTRDGKSVDVAVKVEMTFTLK